ncbi:hypothetical protein D3Z60_18330 [Lachnospiraceae bacterium]|nr:hypothetical protein [Lachnospiraceae bacterium]
MFEAQDIKIRFDYSDPEAEDILRCLNTLYSTKEGTQPLDRNFGLNWAFIDKPLPVAQQEYAFEVIKKTREYETRVRVREVTYEFDESNGKMTPVVTLGRGDKG